MPSSRALAGEKVHIDDLEIRPEGEAVVIEAWGQPITADGGQVPYAVLAFQDITRRRQAERELGEYRERLEELVAQRTAELVIARDEAESANRAKSAFLATMSHELRTPLNSILGYAYLWQQDPALSPEQRRQAGVIEQSGQHLLSLIEDVLDIAKIEAGRVVLRPKGLNLAVFIQSLGHLVRPQAEAKGLVFELALTPELPDQVLADEKRLRQILLNLLGNAIKFTSTGRVSLAITGDDRREAPADLASLRFSVADTGVGLPAEELERIFQPFHQAGSEQARAQGTGLGLSISQKLAGLMGGRIEVTSQPGQGSTFTLTVALPRTAEEPPLLAAAGPVITGYTGGPYTLLIVDDNSANRALLRDALVPLGFSVVEAEDGRQGFEQAEQTHPALILTDLRMPRLNGMAMTRRLRAWPGGQATPVIGISASAYETDRQEFLEAGGSAFLTKPVHLPDLLAMLRTHLGLEWRYHSAPFAPPPPVVHMETGDNSG